MKILKQTYIGKRTEDGRPYNILFLMTDQLQAATLGCYGGKQIPTPALDTLAASGILLNRAYCQDPICVPSRNSILFGRYSHSTGVLLNRHRTQRELLSFPQYLRENNYRTACFGKLHVYGRDDLDWDESVVEDALRVPKQASERNEIPRLTTTLHGKQVLGAPSSDPEEEHMEYISASNTIRFFEQNLDTPWFVQCSFLKPHPPFQPPRQYWDLVDRSTLKIPDYPEDDLEDTNPLHREFLASRGLNDLTDEQIRDAMHGYYGNVAFCDAQFKRVLDALDRLGLRERTLVVYTSDHGEMLGNHHLWTKFCFFEEAVRVPLIMSLPGFIPTNQKSDVLVELIDLFPTFMDYLGLETPASVQGKSMWPLVTGQTDKHRDVVRSEFYRLRDGVPVGICMRFDGRFKFIYNGSYGPPELYDHSTDPYEITNIADHECFAERIKGWMEDLKQWSLQDVVEPLPIQGSKRRYGKN